MLLSSMKRPGCLGLLRFLSSNSGKLTKPKCPLRTPRLFSVSASLNCPINDAPVRQWALEVNPFSTVRAQLGCSISVHPLDPHTFPEADRAFVTVHGAETEQQLGLEHFMVSYDEQSKELLISAQEVSSSVSIDLAAPIKSSECPLAPQTVMITLGILVISAVAYKPVFVRSVHHHTREGQCAGEEDGV